jgi:hypothetical protein
MHAEFFSRDQALQVGRTSLCAIRFRSAEKFEKRGTTYDGLGGFVLFCAESSGVAVCERGVRGVLCPALRCAVRVRGACLSVASSGEPCCAVRCARAWRCACPSLSVPVLSYRLTRGR